MPTYQTRQYKLIASQFLCSLCPSHCLGLEESVSILKGFESLLQSHCPCTCMSESSAGYKGLREEGSNNSYLLYMFYILINIMSINVKVHLYIMINYIVPALTEAIFPEVKSFVRVDGSLSILWQYRFSQIM